VTIQRKKPAAIGVKAPLPGFIEPALASSIEKVPSGERWLHEIKFDGYRVQVHLANQEIKVFTRRGERAAREFFRWRAVPEKERSPAPAWWWQPAFQVLDMQEEMDPQWCHRLELPFSSTYAQGAAVLMAQLAGQTYCLRRMNFQRS
jgi:hypothetical protein